MAPSLSRAALRSRSLSIRSRRNQRPSPPGPTRSSAARCCLRDAPPADKRNRCSTRLVAVVSDQPAFAVKKRWALPSALGSLSILQPATRFEPNCSPLSAQIRYKGDSANYSSTESVEFRRDDNISCQSNASAARTSDFISNRRHERNSGRRFSVSRQRRSGSAGRTLFCPLRLAILRDRPH